jgi:hypothetical protein
MVFGSKTTAAGNGLLRIPRSQAEERCLFPEEIGIGMRSSPYRISVLDARAQDAAMHFAQSTRSLKGLVLWKPTLSDSFAGR